MTWRQSACLPSNIFFQADCSFAGLQIIAIAADDPKADSLNDVEDVERCALDAVYMDKPETYHHLFHVLVYAAPPKCNVILAASAIWLSPLVFVLVKCSVCQSCFQRALACFMQHRWCAVPAGSCQGSWKRSVCGSGTTRWASAAFPCRC